MPSARSRWPRKKRTGPHRPERTRSRASLRGSSLGELLDQKGADVANFDVGCDEGFADPAREDEGQRAAIHLLVLSDQLHQPIGVRQTALHLRQMGRQAGRRKVACDALGLGGRKKADPRREGEGTMDTERDRLAMQQAVGKAGSGLEGMAERMAKIEQRALA